MSTISSSTPSTRSTKSVIVGPSTTTAYLQSRKPVSECQGIARFSRKRTKKPTLSTIRRSTIERRSIARSEPQLQRRTLVETARHVRALFPPEIMSSRISCQYVKTNRSPLSIPSPPDNLTKLLLWTNLKSEMDRPFNSRS